MSIKTVISVNKRNIDMYIIVSVCNVACMYMSMCIVYMCMIACVVM